MNDKPFVTVIVPVKNFERTINRTFEYLLGVDYPHQSWEIIIADGGSTDKTLNIVSSWQKKHDFIKLVQIPNCPSPAFARNRALDNAKGDFIFFTDGDCAPCKEWISIMLSHFARDSKIGAVGGEIYTLRVDSNSLTEAFCEHFKFNMVSPRYGFIGEGCFPEISDRMPISIAGHKSYFFVTANVAYRREAMEDAKAKFWDNPTGEDVDLSIQIRDKGWRLYFAPNAKVDHMHRSTFKALCKVWVTYGAAHPQLLKKHASRHLQIVFQTLKRQPTISIPSPIKGFIYLGNFHLMSLFGLFFLFGLAALLILGFSTWLCSTTVASFLLAAYYMFRFFFWCWYMMPRKYFLSWCFMKYMTNLFFMLGGLKGSRRYSTLCIEPSF